MNYRNQWAKNKNIDPHDELEKFVINNRTHINLDQIKFALRELRAIDEKNLQPRAIDTEDLLREFIKTRSPYEVLKNCFYNLYEVYQKIPDNLPKFDMPPNDSVLVDHLLEYFGFRKKVQPTGFSQIRADIEQHLESEKPNQIDKAMQDLLNKIFLFYHYTLFQYVEQDPRSEVRNYEYAEDVDLLKELNNLHNHYQTITASYFVLMRDFMKFIAQHNVLSSYCHSHFQRKVPLNENQIAELGMFTLYRNIVSHQRPKTDKWEENVRLAKINFKNMDATTRNEWEGNWKHVVNVYETSHIFPPETIMVQRMITFFNKFLDSMSESEIYPKVIVLRSYTVDEYGIQRITANVDTGETILLTDYEHDNFLTNTFTEYYYHSCTNPTGIEPNLVPKEELENWGTQRTDNTENVEDT